MDRIAAMTAFVEVADRRGFAAAARKLRLSPSAVTRLVAALEDHLEIRLLQRTTRSVALTDVGARYLDRVRRILADLAEAEAGSRRARVEPTGRFVVAAPNVFGRCEVAPLLWEFLARYPAVAGELALSDRMVDLIDEGIDVAIRIGPLDDSSLHARVVGRTRRVVVASPKYLASRGRPRQPADLAKHALLHFAGLGNVTEWRFVRDGRERRIPIVPAFTSNSADAVIGYAERDGGLAMVLSYQVAEAVRGGALDIVLARHEPPALPIHAVYPSARQLSANVRAFIEMTVATRTWNFVDL